MHRVRLFSAYIGIGSNQGDRCQLCREGVLGLAAQETTVIKISSLYETTAVDYEDQPNFYNAVVEVTTTHDPFSLLKQCQKIEQQFGKRIIIPKGPRTLDLDILFYDNQIIRQPDLVIPHPSALKRLFVLIPMAEIAPHYTLSNSKRDKGQSIKEILNTLPINQAVQKISESGWADERP